MARQTAFTVLAVLLLSGSAMAQSAADKTQKDPITENETPDYVAMTTANPEIAEDQLQIVVRPLTISELQIEAEAWFKLLRAKAKQIAAARLGVKKTSEILRGTDATTAEASMSQVETALKMATEQDEEVRREVVSTAVEQAGIEVADSPNSEGSDGDQVLNPDALAQDGGDAEAMREDLLEDVTILQDERTALSDRLGIVLDSIDLKGGDTKQYRDYIIAISGIELDTSDVSSAWSGLVGWMTSKEGGQRWAWNFSRFLVILVITVLIAKVLARLVNWLMDRKIKLSVLAERLISRTIKNIILAIGFAIALTALEIDITPIIAAIGATGLVVGLALQGTLSNFASGLMILINRPFDVGDVVTAGGVTGTVDQMNLVSTKFRTFDNQTIYVPNNEIWNNVITNITANEDRRVDLEFGIGYQDDFENAESIIRDVVSNHELVLSDPEPVVVTHALADSSVNIVCRPWAKTGDWWSVKTDITRAVKKRFDEAGITIPYPQQDVHVHQVSG